MDTQSEIKRPGWFLPMRLITYVIIFIVVVFWMDFPHYLQIPFILYSIMTLGVAILQGLVRRFALSEASAIVVAIQFLFEIVIESGIVFTTGNVNSPFIALFLLTIVSASLTYRLIGTLVIASLASVADAVIIWLGMGLLYPENTSIESLPSLFSTQDTAFYSVFLHILIFYLLAFISGYLAEKLRLQDRQLEVTNRALRIARLETDDILRHLNSGLLTVDAYGKIIYFNRAAERILGYRESEVKGMHSSDVFSERMPQLSTAIADGIAGNSQPSRKEIKIMNNLRERIPLGVSTSRLLENGRELRGVIAIFSDLTEAKQLEQKIRVADRMAAIGELSASIAHEIRNPLAAISGSVEILKSELEPSGQNIRLMDLIVKESDRLSKITTEFLQYARINRPTLTKVELCHVVNDIMQVIHHHRSFEPHIRQQFESDDSIMYVIGEEDLIKQLLLNLAVNACEAFDKNQHTLTFSIRRKDDDIVELCVIDDGDGIPEENLKRIYEPFFSTKKEGTGLGLAIVHRVCSALKLKIKIDSKAGQGTCFKIDFCSYNPNRQPVSDENEIGSVLHPSLISTT